MFVQRALCWTKSNAHAMYARVPRCPTLPRPTLGAGAHSSSSSSSGAAAGTTWPSPVSSRQSPQQKHTNHPLSPPTARLRRRPRSSKIKNASHAAGALAAVSGQTESSVALPSTTVCRFLRHWSLPSPRAPAPPSKAPTSMTSSYPTLTDWQGESWNKNPLHHFGRPYRLSVSRCLQPAPFGARWSLLKSPL
jgi:hypothetical protein